VVAAGSDDASIHLRRAVQWYRCSRGPVSELERTRARDIARGSLRLWLSEGGVPESPDSRPAVPLRARAQLARVALSALVRNRCAALRAELAAEAARLSRRDVGTFEDRVRRQVQRAVIELDEAAAARLAELGLPDEPGATLVKPRLPARRRPRLENRLTTVLGAGFGCGVSLTIGRLVADLRPAGTPAVAVVCGLIGLALTSWIIQARRLLAERAAAERWMVDVLANLRSELEERTLTRMLLAELAAVAGRLRDTPN
jgi:xanthosine utilization system XapX-like protein